MRENDSLHETRMGDWVVGTVAIYDFHHVLRDQLLALDASVASAVETSPD